MVRCPLVLDWPWAADRAKTPRRGRPLLTLVLVAILVGAGFCAGASIPAQAQTVATAEPAIVVFGTGEATAPAASATVQMIVGRGRGEFGFSAGPDGGGGFSSSSGPADETDFVTELEEVIAEATPEAQTAATPDARGGATAEARGRKERQGREPRARRGPVSGEELAPLVAVIAERAGISTEDVDVDFSPLATEPFGGREENARLAFDTALIAPEAITGLIVAVSDTAAANGLVIEIAGVRYNPADCDALESEAELAAIEDARAHAERLAGNLNVTLGEVIGAQVERYFSPESEGGCAGQEGFYYESGYGGLSLTVPVFDPTSEGEITVRTGLIVAYAIANPAE
jgi:hypothetical protein